MPDVAEPDQDRQFVMELLAGMATDDRPRLFAIYGLCHQAELGAIMGWGMQFPHGGTIFSNPRDSSTHFADSAERVLETHAAFADVRLTWLD